MAGYQFIHYEGYSLSGSTQKSKKTGGITKTRSVSEIIAETNRIRGNCPHIENPKPPIVILGQLEKLEAVCQDWASNTKDALGRKLRKDAQCLLAGVISFPREREQKNPQDWEKFKARSIKYLERKYGDRLKCVVEHEDESHPHLHFYVVPRIGEKFEDIHEGVKAQNAVKEKSKQYLKDNPKEKEPPKDLQKGGQNLAYIQAMRLLQDEFYEKVGIYSGLARLGPGRRRLSRSEWKAEQQESLSKAKMLEKLQNLKAVAEKGFLKGYKSGKEKAKIEGMQAGEHIGSILAGILGGFHAPTEQARQALKEAEKKAKDEKARHVAELQRVEAEAKRREEQLQEKLDKETRTAKNLEQENEELAEKLQTYVQTSKAPELDKIKIK